MSFEAHKRRIKSEMALDERTFGKAESAACASWQPRLGEVVAVLDARGFWLRKVVVEVDTGRDFPCHDVAWQDEQEWTPWPIEDVAPLAEHPDALSREEYQRGL